jgi:hypothetical protein
MESEYYSELSMMMMMMITRGEKRFLFLLLLPPDPPCGALDVPVKSRRDIAVPFRATSSRPFGSEVMENIDVRTKVVVVLIGNHPLCGHSRRRSQSNA